MRLLLRHLPDSSSAFINPRLARTIPTFPSPSLGTPNTKNVRLALHISPRHTAQQFPRASHTATMATTDATLRAFFQSPKYAVVGASTNTEKYGYKVFKWYVTHNLSVTPINPGSAAIQVDGTDYPTVASLSALQEPEQTSVSVITPPKVTRKTLEEAKGLGIRAVFLQPGAFDDDVLAYARDNFKTVLAGEGGAGSEGWCVLVDGERGLQAAGKL